jgi:hypothetical protein
LYAFVCESSSSGPTFSPPFLFFPFVFGCVIYANFCWPLVTFNCPPEYFKPLLTGFRNLSLSLSQLSSKSKTLLVWKVGSLSPQEPSSR